MKKITILGAGPSGLSAGWQLASSQDNEIDIYEASDRVGGVCGYYDFNGLKMDYGPHKLYSVIPGIVNSFQELMGPRLNKVVKKHKIIVRGRLLDYPVKLKQVLSIFTPTEVLLLGFSVLEAMTKKPFKKPVSYEDYCISVFGKKIYHDVFKPLAEKTWGDPRNLSKDIAITRIPSKGVIDILLKMAGIRKVSANTDAEIIFYPKKGFYDICECVAGEILEKGHRIHCFKRPIKIVREGSLIKSVIFNDNTENHTDLLVSSIPMEELYCLLFPEDIEKLDKNRFVRMRHCQIIYLMVNKPKVLDEHWIFCADKKVPFARISEQKLLSSEGFPEDKTVISCDLACDDNDFVWRSTDEAVARLCINSLNEMNILKEKDVVDYRVVRIPKLYPVYEIGYFEKLKTLLEKINTIENIIITGRLGLCNHSNIDHCLDMGIFISKELSFKKMPADINKGLLENVRSYYIVD